MPRTSGITTVEVTYEDGSKEKFRSTDWQIYGQKSISPIPPGETAQLRVNTFTASRREIK